MRKINFLFFFITFFLSHSTFFLFLSFFGYGIWEQSLNPKILPSPGVSEIAILNTFLAIGWFGMVASLPIVAYLFKIFVYYRFIDPRIFFLLALFIGSFHYEVLFKLPSNIFAILVLASLIESYQARVVRQPKFNTHNVSI